MVPFFSGVIMFTTSVQRNLPPRFYFGRMLYEVPNLNFTQKAFEYCRLKTLILAWQLEDLDISHGAFNLARRLSFPTEGLNSSLLA